MRRSRLAVVALACGLALGFVAGQFGYLRSAGFWPATGSQALLAGAQGSSVAHRVLQQTSSGLPALLQEVAPAVQNRPREVMIAISNYHLVETGMLPMWLESVRRTGVTSYLVTAIDTRLRDWCQENGWNVWYRDIKIDKTQQGTGDNHAISALKFKIILDFLDAGWNVLLSDVDIVMVQNPFDHLWRDHDLEGMSDGFDMPTAYGAIIGHDDPSMGWARYAQGMEHYNLNSGCFYLAANGHTQALMARIAARVAAEKIWDQSAYNQELFTLPHGPYTSPNVSVRVAEMYVWMNSKVLFKEVRHLPKARQPKPVLVHVNYHPDKEARARAVFKYYLEGDNNALRDFPGGSEPGS